MIPFIPPLFAIDIGDIVNLIIIFLVIVGPMIAQLLSKARQIQPPGGQPRPPGGNPRPQPAPRDMADEIGEFLRRAAKRREEAAAPPAEAQPAPAEMQPARPAELRPLRPAEQKPAAPAGQPLQAEVVVAAPVGGRVAQHVAQYLDEQDIEQREAELGKEVARADQKIDQRLHQVFDHRVSRLETVPGEAAAPPSAYESPDLTGAGPEAAAPFAVGLTDLLTNPDSLAQAIVLVEILKRPEERWGVNPSR